MDTALNTSWYGGLQLRITWGTFTDIASTGTALTTTQIDASMEICTPDADTPYSALRFMETRVTRQPFSTVTAQSDFPVNLITGLTAVRSILISSKDGSSLDLAGRISTLK